MIAPAVEWIAFAVFAFIAVAGALGMTTTMSMFRSGIFLMASFIGVAGLFILLLADLIALLQVMMYIGGMLVMILFMLLFSHDPGGAMMSTHMQLKGPERWFSLGLARKQAHGNAQHAGHGGAHEGHHQEGHGAHGQHAQHEEHQDHHGSHGGGMSMQDMSMYTAIKWPAAILGALTGALLVALLIWRPHWAMANALPDPDSPARIGDLLMGKYMPAFEGAGLMILLGIFGAVLVQRPAMHPGSPERDRLQAASEDSPPPVESDALEPEVLDLRGDDER